MAQHTASESDHPTGTIPSFTSVEEEAAFWDSHDSARYEAEFEQVTDVRFVTSGTKRGLTVRFDAETLEQLRRQAEQKGIGPSTLVRMWVMERLRAG